MTHTPLIASYDLDRPLQVRLKHVSGRITVTTSTSATCRVSLSAHAPAGQRLVDSATIRFDASSQVAALDIKVGPDKARGNTTQMSVLWGAFKIPSTAQDSSVDVVLEVPEGTILDLKTVSGDVDCSQALLGRMDFSSVSGDLTCAAVQGSAQLKSVSGTLTVHTVRGPLRASTVSGSVRTGAVHGSIEIETVSGSVSSCIAVPADVTTKTLSGDIVVSVVPDLPVAVDAKSVSGKLRSTIALDVEPEAEVHSMLAGAVMWQKSAKPLDAPTTADSVVSISAKSLSGDILIQTLASP